MSMASVYPASELHSSHSSLATLSHSLDDIQTWSTSSATPTTASALSAAQYHHHQQQHYLLDTATAAAAAAGTTIEQLRAHMSSCYTCGVCWTEDQVSLDCSECGGYTTQRPCPVCDGRCAAMWKRDFTLSHESSKAKWQGTCALNATANSAANGNNANAPTIAATTNDPRDSPLIAQELCTRLEQLSATPAST